MSCPQNSHTAKGRDVFIYALVDPRSDEVFYVGRTVDPARRLSAHMRAWDGSAYSKCKDLLAVNLKPRLVVLETIPGIEDATPEQIDKLDRYMKSAELRWLRSYHRKGAPLVNIHPTSR